MCWQCNHPEATWQDYVEHLRGLLEQHRWIVQGVQRERHRPPYAYTVGLPKHQRPELVVTGLPYDQAADLLNSVAEHVVHAETPPLPGEVIPLRGGPVIEIVRVAEPGIHLHDAHQTENCIRGHEAVGIERHGELVSASPLFAEIADIAGLVTRVHRTPPVGDRDTVTPALGHPRKQAARRQPDSLPPIVAVGALPVAGCCGVLRLVASGAFDRWPAL